MVVPSQFFRSVAGEFRKHIGAKPVIICTKGFEEDTGKMMADIIAEALPEAMPGVMAGPSFAGEIARGLPAALTLATRSEEIGHAVANALGSRSLRLYWTSDMLGAQLGGAVKNVIAIACGIVTGRELGQQRAGRLDDARLRRADALRHRHGRAAGDADRAVRASAILILTCSSDQSRNMSLGKALGEGRALADILGARKSVSEGAHSAAAAVARGRELGIELPICEAVRAILAGETTVDEAITALLSRPFRSEAEHVGIPTAKPDRRRRSSG